MADREALLKGMDTKRALFGMFFAFSNSLQTAGDRFYEEITCKQFFLLICISLFEEVPPTINELAEVMGTTHQNVKQIVNKLEQSGFLKVNKDEQDKRKLRVSRTNKMDLLKEKYEEHENLFFRRFFAGISETEIEVVYQTISKLDRNLTEIKEDLV